MEAVGIIGSIGNHLSDGQTIADRRHVVLLTGAELYADREAERIDTAWILVPKPPRERQRAWT